jgi:hypothetical protein
VIPEEESESEEDESYKSARAEDADEETIGSQDTVQEDILTSTIPSLKI